MTDEIDTLAEEYWQYYLETNPTEAHLLGDYGRAGEFEEATRESEDTEIAALRRSPDGRRRSTTVASTSSSGSPRAVLVADATRRADVVEKRLRELAADPIFGEQVSMPILMGMLALPEADVAEALAEKFRGLGRYYRELADRQREGVAQRQVPGSVRCHRHGRPARRAAVHADRGRPAAHHHTTAGRARRRRLEGPAARGRSSPTYVPGWRPTATRCATRCSPRARPDDKCGLSWLPDGDDAYAATLRYYTTTDKSAQEIHDIGLAQVAKLADEYRSLGPEVVGSDDLDEIFEAMRSDPKLHFETRRPADRGLRGRDAACLGRDAALVRGAPAGARAGCSRR